MSLWWRAAAPEGLIGGVEEPVTHVSVQGGVPMREDTPSGMHLSHSCRGDPATCQSCHRQQLGYCLSRLHQLTTLVAQYMRWSWCAELQWKALENGECSDTQLEAGDFSRALSFIHCCQCCSCFMWESWDAQGVGGGGWGGSCQSSGWVGVEVLRWRLIYAGRGAPWRSVRAGRCGHSSRGSREREHVRSVLKSLRLHTTASIWSLPLAWSSSSLSLTLTSQRKSPALLQYMLFLWSAWCHSWQFYMFVVGCLTSAQRGIIQLVLTFTTIILHPYINIMHFNGGFPSCEKIMLWLEVFTLSCTEHISPAGYEKWSPSKPFHRSGCGSFKKLWVVPHSGGLGPKTHWEFMDHEGWFRMLGFYDMTLRGPPPVQGCFSTESFQRRSKRLNLPQMVLDQMDGGLWDSSAYQTVRAMSNGPDRWGSWAESFTDQEFSSICFERPRELPWAILGLTRNTETWGQ